MDNNYTIIQNKLKSFARKYYLNELLKGSISFCILFILSSLIVLVIEYFSYLNPDEKKWILLAYLLFMIIGFGYYLIRPILGVLGTGVKLADSSINKLVVKEFPEIQDKLWNLIELNEFKPEDSVSDELVIASIDKRIDSLKNFNFNRAVHFKDNIGFILFFVFIVLIISVIGFLKSDDISVTKNRLVKYNEVFMKPSPYHFSVLNDTLSIGKGEDFKLNIRINTDKDYENVTIIYGGNKYLMNSDSLDYFSYTFKNINNSIAVKFGVEEYLSNEYQISVLPKPLLTSFKIDVDKPSYTQLKNESFENVTELVVPIGSSLKFVFFTYETDSIYIQKGGSKSFIGADFQWNTGVKDDLKINVSLKNKYYFLNDYLNIKVKTIQDDYPSIVVSQLVDSIDYTRVYFKGKIEDDYGFRSLRMVLKLDEETDSILNIQMLPYLLAQDFFYAYDFSEFKGKTSNIDYYFEVGDNDACNGSKLSVSEYFTFSFPSLDDVLEYEEQQFDNIEQLLSQSMNMTKQLRDDMSELKQKLLDDDLTEWERKEVMKNIYSKKMDLEDAIKQIQNKNDELNKYMESFTEQNQDLINKQEQIQSMLEEVMSDELKELMDKFNEMMDNFNQNKMNELSEEMDISLDDLSEQLDKNLELLKRMKIEKQLGLLTDEINKQATRQDELSNKIDSGEKPSDLLEEQKEQQQNMVELSNQYKELEKLNKELSEPLNIYDFDEEFKNIDDEFNKSIENQEKNNKKRSKQSMQNNKSNMENLAFMMQQMKENAFMQDNAESLENLYQILDNVIVFSFEEEKLIAQNSNNSFDSHIMQKQKKLYQDFQIIKDSLYALTKRQPSLDIAVNKEIVSIENNFRRIESELKESRITTAEKNQRNVLTSTNNLSLFLSEVIKQLQNQMANSKPGNQNCEKPGNNPNPNSTSNSLKNMQKSLQQQLDKMMQMMKDGASQGQMNSEMGKALSQQEKMQNMLQRMMNQGNVGSDAYETLKQAEQLLNKVREDLIRNNLSDKTINRQKEILTRLLEAENADNERDIDEKRKSESASEIRISESAKQFENNDTNYNFKEKLVKQKLILTKFYQNKYQNYIESLDSISGTMH